MKPASTLGLRTHLNSLVPGSTCSCIVLLAPIKKFYAITGSEFCASHPGRLLNYQLGLDVGPGCFAVLVGGLSNPNES